MNGLSERRTPLLRPRPLFRSYSRCETRLNGERNEPRRGAILCIELGARISCGTSRSSNLNGDPAPGIVTTHDEFAISWSETEAAEKVERLLRTSSEVE